MRILLRSVLQVYAEDLPHTPQRATVRRIQGQCSKWLSWAEFIRRQRGFRLRM